MLNFIGLWLYKPVCGPDPGAKMLSSPARQAYTRHIALTGLIAGSLLLLAAPARAGAAAQHAKPGRATGPEASAATTPSDASAPTRVSPYVLANRKRAQASRAVHSSAEPISVRGTHKAAGHGQRQ